MRLVALLLLGLITMNGCASSHDSERIRGSNDDESVLEINDVRKRFPALLEEIADSSANGSLYKESNGDSSMAYVVVSEANSMNSSIWAELTSAEGDLIERWKLWEHLYSESTWGPNDEYPGNPVIDKKRLRDAGNVLELHFKNHNNNGEMILLGKTELTPLGKGKDGG